MSWAALTSTAKQGVIIAGIWREGVVFPEIARKALCKPRPGMVSPEPPSSVAEAYDALYGLLEGHSVADAFAARHALVTLEKFWGRDPRLPPLPIEAAACVEFFIGLAIQATVSTEPV